jgi:hypothetical protein
MEKRTWSGDSGGPQFLGAGATETTTQVSITITGDVFCFATNVDYRLDTPQARAFLGSSCRFRNNLVSLGGSQCAERPSSRQTR